MGLSACTVTSRAARKWGGVSPCLFRVQMMGVCLALFFWEVAQRHLAGGG